MSEHAQPEEVITSVYLGGNSEAAKLKKFRIEDGTSLVLKDPRMSKAYSRHYRRAKATPGDEASAYLDVYLVYLR